MKQHLGPSGAAILVTLALLGCSHPQPRAAGPALAVAPAVAPARGLVGTVRDATGAPIEGALVAAVSVAVSDDTATALAQSDAHGAFAMPTLPPGTYGITATAAGKEGIFRREVEIARDRPTHVELALGSDGITLAGTVAGITGRPIPSALVWFARTSNERGDIWFAHADPSGRFRVALPSAAYSVGAHCRGMLHSWTYVSVEQAGQAVHVELEPEDTRSFAGPELVDELKRASVALDTSDPTAPLGNDLDGLAALVGDARLVGLGEGTHGGHENFVVKHRLFRYLVEKLGFTVFAIEASWPDTIALNDFVTSGKGDPTLLVPRMRFWIWDTDEMVALVRWMRAYNADARHARKLSFVGFDMQNAPTAVAAVEAYVAGVDRTYAAQLGRELANLGDEYEANHLERWPAAAREAIRRAVAALLAKFDERKAAWSRRGGEAAWATARHHAEILSQFLQLSSGASTYDTVRERAMADNIVWIVDHQPADARIAVWAANLHVAKQSWWAGPTPSMGGFLREKYGDRYRAFGLSFVEGAIRAIGVSPQRPLMEFAIPPAPAGTVEGTIGRVGPDLVVVDLDHLPPASAAARWARYRLRMRMIGAGYTERSHGAFVSLHPGDLYDALVIIRHMSASHYVGPVTAIVPPVASPTNLTLDAADASGTPTAWRVGGLGINAGYRASVERHGCFEGAGCAVLSRSAPRRIGGFAALEQAVDAAAWRGHRVRLRAAIRLDADVTADGAQLFIQSEGAQGSLISAVNMFDRAVRSKRWGTYDVELDVPPATRVLRFGMALAGDTAAHLDAVALDVVDAQGDPPSR